MLIAAALSGLNAAVSLIKTLRDRLKKEDIKTEEVIGRIGEIYDLIIDTKGMVVDNQEELLKKNDEIHLLKVRVFELEKKLAQREAMKFSHGAYWLKDSGPYCQQCWEFDTKAVRLSGIVKDGELPDPDLAVWIYTCNYHMNTRVMLPSPRKVKSFIPEHVWPEQTEI